MTPWEALGDEMDVPDNVEINKRNHAWAADSIPERNKWALKTAPADFHEAAHCALAHAALRAQNLGRR